MNELKEEINSRIEYIENNASEKTKQKIQKEYKDAGEFSSENLDEEIENLEKQNKKLKLYEKIINALQENIEIDPGRVMGLTDGIFSIVMTLLIFGMVLPTNEIVNYTGFIDFIASILPNMGLTIVSFILLASFWIYHHEFIKIRSLNLLYLWANIFYLASLTFIPFTTSLIGNYSHFFLSNVIFGLNILLTIIFFLIMFYYAAKRGFLDEAAIKKDKKYVYHTLFIIMGFTVLINLLDFFINKNFIYLYLLVPVISTIRDVHYKLK